jgi:signal peptidase I
MTDIPRDAPPASPWLSVWLKPRDTIGRVLVTDPRRHVLLLAAIGAIGGFVAEVIEAGHATQLLDWHVAALVAVGGAIVGIVSLYVYGLFFRWSGRWLGGGASPVQVRAVLAWGGAPTIIGLAVSLMALAWLMLSAGAGASAPRILIVAVQAVAVAVGVWSLVLTLLMLGRVQGFGFGRTIANGVLGLLIAVPVLALPLIIRTFVVQPFNIPSGAMMPTLLVGDYLFVTKYPYGYTHYSLPFSPRLFSGRILASEPQRGDVVVFRLPKDDTTDYIKRVVGLPGDRIQMRAGLLHINDQPVKRERLDDFIDEDGGRSARVKRWRETLPNGVSYETLDLRDNGFLDNTQVYTVPPGHFFMMGDNRDNSTDSRVLSQVGYVPFENIVGRAALLYFSVDRDSGSQAIRLARIGTPVR